MRLICPRDELSATLAAVGRAASSKTTVPVLGNVLVRAEDGRVELSATDMEVSLRAPLAATVIFSFLGSWNSLLWPLMVTGKESMRPIQLGLSVFVNTDSNEPQQLMAAATFTIAPIIVLYFLAQKQFIEGIASSGLKG